MLWLVLLKINDARIALANRRAYVDGQQSARLHFDKSAYLVGNFFLLFPREVDEVIVLGAN